MGNEFDQLKKYIYSNTKMVVELEKLLCAIPALAPENKGDGEWEKCEALEKFLISKGIKNIQHYDAPDTRVSRGSRPNVVATISGNKDDYAIWVMAHLDIVPAGELSLWNSSPFEAIVKEGKIFGRGVEDNQQGLCSGVLAAMSFAGQHILPEHTIKLLFMADEEVGAKYGMGYLVENHLDIFGKDDLILIPDGGDPLGQTIEVAEKNIMWLKFHTEGKQTHGSRPDEGINAHLASCELSLMIHNLGKKFNRKDKLFEPPVSTFEPTMKLTNVEGVNIIPGDDVIYFDCRILPCYKIDQVMVEVKKCMAKIQKKYGVKISVEFVQREESPATPVNAPVVLKLKEAIKNVHGIEGKTIGIGGGTVAAALRNKGINAAVWSTMDETAHQPNEYCIIENILKDASTIAYMCCDGK